jgi:radical SAM protein with 4Fe4S-binding SPASM domain
LIYYLFSLLEILGVFFSVKNRLITILAYLEYVTFTKALNLIKLWLSFHWSRILQRPFIWGLPTTLSIEPTTGCNLRCPECPSGLRSFTRPTGMLNSDLYEKIIDEVSNHLTWLHLYFQGEPFLHPRFLDLVKYADKKRIFTSTSTNAHYLTEKLVKEILHSGLKQVIISMDGITQEIYEKYRVGGDLEKVKKGLLLLIKERRKKSSMFPRIVLQFLVTGQNEHQIPKLKFWAKQIGVDELQLKTAQIYNFENGSELIPSDLGYSRYIPECSGKWLLKKHIENKCWRMWQGAVVTWDGKVVPCCFDKDAQYPMGNLNQNSLDNIWSSKAYRIFRAQLLKDRSQIDICTNCSE